MGKHFVLSRPIAIVPPPTPVPALAAVAMDRVTTSSTEYQLVTEWEVPANRRGALEGVSFNTSDYDNTMWRLVVIGVEKFTEKLIGSSLTLHFGGTQVAAGQKVSLYARSTSGIEIKADGAIYGQES